MDKGAILGLRGFLACHIFVSHVATPPIYRGYLYGTIALPPFYLISGFCLTLAYGNTLWSAARIFCFSGETIASDKSTTLENAGGGTQILDAMPFYKRRLIRILPVHYLTLIVRVLAERMRTQRQLGVLV